MTAEEQSAMAGHMEYWQQLLRDGKVVVYGPVADPEGMWGLGVLRAADRAEVLRSVSATHQLPRHQHL